MNMDLPRIEKQTTKSSTNGSTTLKIKKKQKIKNRDKIWWEKSMLLASLPVLYDEINMIENFLHQDELKKIKELLLFHEFLLE